MNRQRVLLFVERFQQRGHAARADPSDDDLEPRLTRHSYDPRIVVEQFDARPLEIRKLLRGGLDPARTRELTDEMRAAGLPL